MLSCRSGAEKPGFWVQGCCTWSRFAKSWRISPNSRCKTERRRLSSTPCVNTRSCRWARWTVWPQLRHSAAWRGPGQSAVTSRPAAAAWGLIWLKAWGHCVSLDFRSGCWQLSSRSWGRAHFSSRCQKWRKPRAQSHWSTAAEEIPTWTFPTEVGLRHNYCNAAFKWVIYFYQFGFVFIDLYQVMFCLVKKKKHETEDRNVFIMSDYVWCGLGEMNLNSRGQHLRKDDLVEIPDEDQTTEVSITIFVFLQMFLPRMNLCLYF